MSGPDDTLVLSDGTHTVYCPGCNGRYVCPAEQAVCPQCHGPADSVVRGSLAETMLMKTQVDPFSATAPFLPQPDNFDGIIGDSLHVYDFQSLLGCGAMGRVYLATHRDLDRRCALKILSPRVTETEVDYVERFRQEGRAAAALVHPNVVTIHAIGTERGFHFLEMEFVPGRSLQRTLDHEGRLPPVRATVLATGIAEGLSAAHQAHIIHRDLKPDNVLITMQGVPKIGDFGLAKRILTEDRSLGDCLVGTPNFMAPELLAGEPATPASDVYALGVCYFLMLSGRYPFTGRDLAELKHRTESDPLPDIRRLCEDVTLEMAECLSLLMAKTPGNRPQTGIEAAQLLQAVCGNARDIESLLLEAFPSRENVTWMRCGNRYQLHLTLPDGRRQRLFVEPSDHAVTGRLLLIYSVCCKARPEHYELALRMNSQILHGGLAIREIDGETKFIMVDTYPRATVDAEEIRRSVLEVASRADEIERQLTGQDCH